MAIKLPPRNFLTPLELIARWECTENDLRDLIVRGELIPSFTVNHVARKVRFRTANDDEGTYWADEDIAMSEDDDGQKRSKLYDTYGHYFLLHPEASSGLDCIFFYFSKERSHIKGSDDNNICFMFSGSSHLSQGVTLDMVFGNGMVMLSEIERFEALHGKDTSNPSEAQEQSLPQKLTTNSSHWPWGNHHTDLLGHLDAAARRFWVNYDPSDTTTAPFNSDVVGWLKTERKVSRSMAEAIATMLRLDGLPTGPRK